jgi:hypothetical protein
VKSDDEDHDREEERPGPEEVAAVDLPADRSEANAVERGDESLYRQQQAREDNEKNGKPGRGRDRPAEDGPRRRSERLPEDEAAVFLVLVDCGIVFVVQAVDRDVEGVVGQAKEEKDDGCGDKVVTRLRGETSSPARPRRHE